MKKLWMIFSLVMALASYRLGDAQMLSLPVQSASAKPGTVQSFASGIYDQAIVIDPSGNLWIASAPDRVMFDVSYAHRDDKVTTNMKWIGGPGQPAVIEMSGAGQIINWINLQPGPGWTPGDWWGPFSIAIDPSGNLWIPIVVNTLNRTCDTGGVLGFILDRNKVKGCYYTTVLHAIKISPQGIVLGDFPAGNGLADQWIPYVTADASGNLFFTNTSDKLGTGMVSRLDAFGTLQGTFELGNRVYKVAVDNGGNIWGTNTISDNITGGSFLGTSFRTINTHHASTGIAIDQQGNFIVGGNAHEIEKISPAGDILWTASIQNNTGEGPDVIKIDGFGNIWAVNQMNQPNQGAAVIELNSQGMIVATYPMPNPTDLAIDKQGNVWVTNDLSFGNNLYEIVGAAAGAK